MRKLLNIRNLFAYFKTNRALTRELQLIRKQLIDTTIELEARKAELKQLKPKLP
jgi:hypothetical protein